MPETPKFNIRILREPEVREKVALSHVTIWRAVRGNNFPSPIRLGSNSVGWLENEIDEWIATRPRVADASKTEAA